MSPRLIRLHVYRVDRADSTLHFVGSVLLPEGAPLPYVRHALRAVGVTTPRGALVTWSRDSDPKRLIFAHPRAAVFVEETLRSGATTNRTVVILTAERLDERGKAVRHGR